MKSTMRVATMSCAVVAMLAAAGSANAGPETHPRARDGAAAGQAVPPPPPGATGALCKTAFDASTGSITPPDDSTDDNPAAASVTMLKLCIGPVIGRIAAEVTAEARNSFIHVDLRATCIKPKGQNPCTAGDVVYAAPGHTFMATGPLKVQSHAVQMLWDDLPSGQWKFEVLPGGDGTAFMGWRMMTIDAYGQP